jgi:single-stranded-DNA-specific exonuclease
MKDLEKASVRVVEAIENHDPILISGDYDSDGCTATGILVHFFQSLGISVYKFIPHRDKDGYGLSERAIRRAKDVGVSLIISVDCGISAHKEAQLARDLEIDLVITDHHQVPDELPIAHSIVNPHQKDCSFEYKELAGCGLAFYLACGIRKVLRDKEFFGNGPQPDVTELLDLVSLGTIADLVPLTGLNRVLTKAGLARLDQGARTGICALREVSGVSKVNAGAVGFRMAPRINAAGRMDDATLGVNLLLETDATKALEMARTLNDFNEHRQQVEKAIVEHCVKRVEAGDHGHLTIVLAHKEYNAGVAGIVASRLVELYNRPVVIISIGEDGMCKGSGRSIKGFHLFEELKHCSDLLEGFGGHEGAAGLSIKQENLKEFARAFDERGLQSLSEEALTPILYYDSPIELQDLDFELMDCLQTLEPFGMNNPAPVFVAHNLTVSNVRTVGQDSKHLQFSVQSPDQSTLIRCIGFAMGERSAGLDGAKIDMVFKPGINEYRGNTTIQAEVKDFRLTS